MINLNFKDIYEWPLPTRILVILLICSIFFYLGYFFDLSSLNATKLAFQEKEKDLNQQLELTINNKNHLNQEVIKHTQYESLLKIWQQKLINYSNLPEVLNEILRIGANNHLHFSLFNPGEEIKENVYFKIPIKVIAVANYHQLANFISQIANMQWIVVVGNFTISNEAKSDIIGAKLAEEAKAENLLTAELNLEVYHLAQKNK